MIRIAIILSLRRTRTPRDPEMMDRKKLNEMDRRAYLDD